MTFMQRSPDLEDPTMEGIQPLQSKQKQSAKQVETALPPEQLAEKDDLSTAVRSVVDTVITNVALTSSVEDEKIKVQKLITDLVSRVSNEAAKAPIRPTANTHEATVDKSKENAGPEPTKTPVGVPYGDHRLRRISCKPITWMQTLDSITLNILIPAWVRKQHVSVTFTPGSVKARVSRGDEVHVQVDEPLVAQIDVDGCTWAVDDTGGRRQLIIELEKAKEQWWGRLFMTDDPASYSIVDTRSMEQETTVVDIPCDENGDEVTEVAETASARPREQRQGLEDSVTGQGKGNDGVVKEASVEEIVAETVEEVVDAVASTEGVEEVNISDRSSATSKPSEQQGSQQQKVLTREDLTSLIAQYEETFAKGGANATSAAMQLATFHRHGVGVEKNDAEAARYYKYALEHGRADGSAAFQLGLIYNSGAAGLEASAEQAVHWWGVAAGLGNAVAMFNLGVMAMNGSGCDMDPEVATQWFMKAQALNPQLRPPQFSAAQMEQRFAMAARLRRKRVKEMMSPEEKKRRREEALRRARTAGYASVGLVGLIVCVVSVRYWMRNRL
eukprot:GFKZ01006639.1.p1 GENE.GFKZ01006639.1~~GFKZ01006639.1.p1  ORF type:complete len:558 (-),score=75.31 GFKZ01006639.1:889-2562(-)